MRNKEGDCRALVEIFVFLFAAGEVPGDWRVANVVPFIEGERQGPQAGELGISGAKAIG